MRDTRRERIERGMVEGIGYCGSGRWVERSWRNRCRRDQHLEREKRQVWERMVDVKRRHRGGDRWRNSFGVK